MVRTQKDGTVVYLKMEIKFCIERLGQNGRLHGQDLNRVPQEKCECYRYTNLFCQTIE
jgi:hypothetical protein